MNNQDLLAHARRLQRRRAAGDPTVTEAVIEALASALWRAYLAEDDFDLSCALRVEADLAETPLEL